MRAIWLEWNKGWKGLTDLARRPADTILVGIDAIDHQLPTPPTIMNRILQDLNTPRRLHHDIKSIRVLTLDLLEHRTRILPAQRHVFIRGVEALGQIDLEALRGGDDDMAAAVLTKHLGEDEAGGTGAEHED